MQNVIQFIVNIFKFHKKKIAFFLGSIVFGIVVLFPYDDTSDYITRFVTQQTRSNVYLQFDGLSFGFMPQLGLKMENVVVESVYFPTMAVKTLGLAPTLSTFLGNPAGRAVAYGLFNGKATIDLSSSNQLNIEGQEVGLNINLEDVSLKELAKFAKKQFNLSIAMSGKTNFESQLYVDPKFKTQPKGEMTFKVKNLDIPSSNIPINMGGGVVMGMAMPALKLSELNLQGNMSDGKLFIKNSKIGGPKNDLNGSITGDFDVKINNRGKAEVLGYDLKINLNIKSNLKRQLATILSVVDIYQGIGDKYKFDTLDGIRYSMRVTSGRTLKDPPKISSF